MAAEPDGGAKGLRFHRKVHQTHRCRRIHTDGDLCHALRLQAAVSDQFPDAAAHQLNAGKGQQGQGLFVAGCALPPDPVFHIMFQIRHLLGKDGSFG